MISDPNLSRRIKNKLPYVVVVLCALWSIHLIKFDDDRAQTDLGCYIQGSQGIFPTEQQAASVWTGETSYYIYPQWTAFVFRPLSWIGFSAARWIWFFFTLIAMLHLTRRILVHEYGFLFVIGSSKLFIYVFTNGNIDWALSTLALTPLGCLLAGCFKLYVCAFVPLHFCLEISRRRKSAPIQIPAAA